MKSHPKLGKLLALALCCVVLVLFAAEAGHMHAPGSDSAHCPLCVVAHLGVHIVLPAGIVARPTQHLCVAEALYSGAAAGHLVLVRIRPPPARIAQSIP